MFNKKSTSAHHWIKTASKIWEGILHKNFRVYAFFAFLTLIFSGFIFPKHWMNAGNGDWDYHYFTLNVFAKSICRYGEFPFWNPWSGGGYDYLVNPQTIPLGFFSLLALLFPTHIALKLGYILYYLLGLTGMYSLMSKKMKIDKSVAVWASCVFVFSSYFTWHIFQQSHANTCTIFLLPWLVYFYIDFKEKGWHWKNIIFSILTVAQLILGGGTHFIIYLPLFFSVYVLLDVLFQKAGWKSLLFPLVIFGLGIGVSLWKLYPSFLYAIDNPRPFQDITKTNFINLFQSFTDQAPANDQGSYSFWGWWEHGAYFSVLLIALIIYYWKEVNIKPATLVFFIFLLWMALGNFPMYFNPWYYLNKYAPVFSSLRVPFRIIVFTLFGLTLAAAIVFHKKRKEHPLWNIVMFATLFHLWIINNSIQDNYKTSAILSETLQDIEESEEITFKSVEDDRKMYHLQYHNIGVINSYEPMPFSYHGFKNIDHSDSLTLPLYDNTKAKLTSWTPNTIKLEMKGDSVIFNQNFADGWHVSSARGKLFNASGRLGLAGQKGKEFEITYSNPNIRTGFILALTSLVITISLLILTTLANKRKGKYPL